MSRSLAGLPSNDPMVRGKDDADDDPSSPWRPIGIVSGTRYSGTRTSHPDMAMLGDYSESND